MLCVCVCVCMFVCVCVCVCVSVVCVCVYVCVHVLHYLSRGDGGEVTVAIFAQVNDTVVLVEAVLQRGRGDVVESTNIK